MNRWSGLRRQRSEFRDAGRGHLRGRHPGARPLGVHVASRRLTTRSSHTHAWLDHSRRGGKPENTLSLCGAQRPASSNQTARRGSQNTEGTEWSPQEDPTLGRSHPEGKPQKDPNDRQVTDVQGQNSFTERRTESSKRQHQESSWALPTAPNHALRGRGRAPSEERSAERPRKEMGELVCECRRLTSSTVQH